MASYTHYWTNTTCENALAIGNDGKPLNHTAGNMFRKVEKGDHVYVVTVLGGQLHLIGKMTVSKIANSDAEAARLLGTDNLWSADRHLIATNGECTRQVVGRKVPLDVAKKLTFESPDGPRSLKFTSSGALDQQTLRGVRKLTRSSVELLNSVLKQ